MRIITASALQDRIIKVASEIVCQIVNLGKRGKFSQKLEEDLLELMLIHEFLPFWNETQIRQKECYLNEKFNV